jgi:hypothetical protein
MNDKNVNIFFAPISNGKLYSNFEKTVLYGLEICDIDSKHIEKIVSLKNKIRLWGIRDAKKTTYDKTKIGDFVLFYKEGFIIGYSKINSLLEDEDLSIHLWGIFENKQRGEKYTWLNLLIFNDFTKCKIPFSTFRDLAQYNEKFSIRGYIQFRENATRKIISSFESIEKFIKIHTIE